jgi:hypothetical protein
MGCNYEFFKGNIYRCAETNKNDLILLKVILEKDPEVLDLKLTRGLLKFKQFKHRMDKA